MRVFILIGILIAFISVISGTSFQEPESDKGKDSEVSVSGTETAPEKRTFGLFGDYVSQFFQWLPTAFSGSTTAAPATAAAGGAGAETTTAAAGGDAGGAAPEDGGDDAGDADA